MDSGRVGGRVNKSHRLALEERLKEALLLEVLLMKASLSKEWLVKASLMEVLLKEALLLKALLLGKRLQGRRRLRCSGPTEGRVWGRICAQVLHTSVEKEPEYAKPGPKGMAAFSGGEGGGRVGGWAGQ
jgi:hypothetical protein